MAVTRTGEPEHDELPDTDRGRSGPPAAVRVEPVSFGVGVFASRAFAVGELVGRIPGRVVSGPDYESDYAVRVSEQLSLDPHGPFRELNHRCEPNCQLRISVEPVVVRVVAASDIGAGEELTIDYGWPADSTSILCACDSARCRTWVVAESELDNWLLLLGWTDWDAAPEQLRSKFADLITRGNMMDTDSE